MSDEVKDIVPVDKTERHAGYQAMEFRQTAGGLQFLPRDFMQVMSLANLMSQAKGAVPEHLIGNAGACLSVCNQALLWNFEPFSVAKKSYLVKGVIAYESQLISAIINTRANLSKRPEIEYTGEGDARVCKVTLTFTNGDVRTYTSPEFAKILPKNSPLWKTDPDQQHAYYSLRACARRWLPEILLGVYDRDEIEGAEPMRNITPIEEREKPNLLERMGKGTEGFSAEHVAREMGTERALTSDERDARARAHALAEVRAHEAEERQHKPTTQHVIEGQAEIIEPIRTGPTIPGETVGAVRADAKGVGDKSRRKGKKDAPVDAEQEPHAAPTGDGAESQAGHDGGGAGDAGPKADGEGIPGVGDTTLLTKLSDAMKPLMAEKAIRTQWKITFETQFADRPEKVRKAAGTILNANVARVAAEEGTDNLTAAECQEHCDRAIARVATEGDLFGEEKA